MAKACGALLFVALFAAAVQATPAPLPKASAKAPTFGQLRQRLLARGIAVEAVQRQKGRDDWHVTVRLSLVSSRLVSYQREVVVVVPADGADERRALEEMLAEGYTAASIAAQEPITFSVY